MHGYRKVLALAASGQPFLLPVSSSPEGDLSTLFQADPFSSSVIDPFSRLERMDRLIDEQFRSFDSAIERASKLEERAFEQAQKDGRMAPQTYRREERGEEKLADGGTRSFYYSESVTTFGSPYAYQSLPAQHGIGSGAIALVLFAATYVAVAVRFAMGFARTRFRKSYRPLLMVLWPALAIASPNFRRELRQAVLPSPEGEGTGMAESEVTYDGQATKDSRNSKSEK